VEVLEEVTEKVAKEVVEEVAEKVAKDGIGEGVEKVVKEVVEEVDEKIAKEIAEESVEKIVRETGEAVLEQTAKEALEEIVEKAVKETSEELVEKIVKKEIIEKTTKEVSQEVVAKAIKETGGAITSASVGKASKEVKEKLIKQVIKTADDKTAALVRSVADKIGDDVVSVNKLVALVQKYGDDAVKALKAVKPETAAKVLRSVDENILDDVVRQGSDAFAAFSGWTEKELKEHGKDLAARATKDAEVLNDVKTLISKGPIDPKNLTDEQKRLIEKIAANSTYYVDGEKVVVGKWVGLDGGFLMRAKETGSLHYSPHPDLWELFGKLDNQNEAAWLINKQVIQTGIDKGLPFEYTLSGIKPDNLIDEANGIEAIWKNATDDEIMDAMKLDYVPVRIQELKELYKDGYQFSIDSITNSYILIKP